MNVSLTAELEKFVKGEVNAGRYQTASEVVREALRLLLERRALIDELEAKIDEALDDVANGRTISPEEARERLRQHRRARAAAARD